MKADLDDLVRRCAGPDPGTFRTTPKDVATSCRREPAATVQARRC